MYLDVAGERVAASTGGRHSGDGSLVVFVHGAGHDKSVWSLQTRWFAHHGFSVLAVDLPGHGQSSGAPLDDIRSMGDWLGAVIEATGTPEASIVGHSLGSYVALDVAARLPDRIDSVVLVGAAATMSVHHDLMTAAIAGDAKAFDLASAWSFGRRAHAGGHRSPGLWMLGGGKRMMRHVGIETLAVDLAACDRHTGAIDDASALRCRALVVSGGADRMTPAPSGKLIADAITGSRMLSVADAGHMVMVERPDEFNRAVAAFLSDRA